MQARRTAFGALTRAAAAGALAAGFLATTSCSAQKATFSSPMEAASAAKDGQLGLGVPWPRCGDPWHQPAGGPITMSAEVPSRTTAARGFQGSVVITNTSGRTLSGTPGWLDVVVRDGHVVGFWSNPYLTEHGPITLQPGRSFTMQADVPRLNTCGDEEPAPTGVYTIIPYGWIGTNPAQHLGTSKPVSLTVAD